MPTSATWKIGALGFLLMATMNGLPLMPARCWKDAADAASQIDLGLDGFPGRAHLPGFLQPLGVHHGPRAAHCRAHCVGQFLRHGDVIFFLDAAADGHQNAVLGDIDIARLPRRPSASSGALLSSAPTSADLSITDPPAGAFSSGLNAPGRTVTTAPDEISQRTCALT